MIAHLAFPSVCVVDDEEVDYKPILAALNEMFVSFVHLTGEVAKLPASPFDRLRLVFLDLHLSGNSSKTSASHTANVFRRLVSSDTAPVVVVIWSKYASQKVHAPRVPAEDQETESQLFQRTLLGAVPEYRGRLIFLEMAKPRAEQQPAEWTEELKTQIATALGNQPAIDVLWSWDNLVKIACTKVGSDLTSVAASVVDGTQHGLADGLKASMQKLTHAQGEGDLSKATAPHHLSTALTGLLADQLEHPGNLGEIAPHSDWLSAEQPAVALGNGFAARMNGLLVASDVPPSEIFFVPGTVYTVTGKNLFKKLTGRELGDFFKFCCSDLPLKISATEI